MDIQVKKATRENIAPFGQLIKSEIKNGPTFFNDNFSYWKQQGLLKSVGDIEIGILDIKSCELNFSQMEKHDKTFECMVSLNDDFIIALGLAIESKIPAGGICAFHIRHGDVLQLNPGCWHSMPCAVNPNLKMLIIFKNNTSAEDLTIHLLDDTCLLLIT